MTNSFCTFHSSSSLCGIPVDQVLEIADEHACTPIPLSAPAIAGLINLRGQIITAIHLNYLLAEPDHEFNDGDLLDSGKKKNVIVNLGEEKFSLLVDDVGPVMQAPSNRIEEVPSNMIVRANEFVSGLARMPTCIVLMLDLNLLNPRRLQTG